MVTFVKAQYNVYSKSLKLTKTYIIMVKEAQMCEGEMLVVVFIYFPS